MSNFTINEKYITKPSAILIEVIKKKLKETNSFIGIGEEKEYNIKSISSKEITYVGSARNQGQPESVNINDLIIAIEVMKKLPVFNTNTDLLKEKIPSSLYRKRTPLFGILAQAEIIIEPEI